MLQTLYFHVFRRVPGETLTFCEINFGHKNTPPPKPRSPDINMQCFPNIFILLGALNVMVCFNYKKIGVNNALS